MTRITFPRLARSYDAVLDTPATTTADIEAAVAEFARHHCASPRFDVTVTGDLVLVSSLTRAGTPEAGDFGVGHITHPGSRP